MSDTAERYHIDVRAGIVEILGPDDVRHLERAVRAAVRDPAFRRGMGFLRDRHGLPAPSTSYIHAAVVMLDLVEEMAGSRWALVAPDAASYGMSRMAAILSRRREVQVFESREAARAWLARGQPPGPDQETAP